MSWAEPPGSVTGQLRSGAVASVTSVRFSQFSGGLACVAGVVAVCAALPSFRRYRAGAGRPARALPCGGMREMPEPPAMGPTVMGPTVMGLPEWTVLAVISQQPTHGFAVAQLTTPDGELGRVWQIPRPVIYRAIGRLAEAGLITPQGTEPGQGPQRTIYAATSEGHGAAARWLEMPVAHIRDIRSHLLLKLALLYRRGTDASALIRRQRETLAPIAAAIDAEVAGDAFDGTLLAWRRASAAAAIAFLDDISARAAVSSRNAAR
jgi:DNA-binding PadR family transcriptional regulator